ncbi:hypothetical protein DICVIV_06877 [Dictyocaulus viviparus]|uniref:Uncharacterized protein n=1 Tax=Dictyocaulus viviparus TaxID=29172 RepID=A0A0D8XQW3_DICVI|nr:hypothetical protein DICVIV_06877 [Dictyocaulus viviparus]
MFGVSYILMPINYTLSLCAIASMCLTCSVFDFIVMNEMYYTVPDLRLLILPELSLWFYVTSVVCFTITFITLLASNARKGFRTFVENHSQLFSLLHGICLSVSCILCGYCTFLAIQMSDTVGKYAFNSTPKHFEEASHWYFIRLRALAILFSAESILQMIVLSVVYLGIECRYQPFSKASQKSDVVVDNRLFV